MLLVPEFVVFRIAKILTNQKNISCGKIESPKLQKSWGLVLIKKNLKKQKTKNFGLSANY